jgi:hypothetical protein
VESTAGRASVSKMFWIPPYAPIEEADKRRKFFELKASPWAQVKTYLLTVVDENGIPFHLMANEDKPFEAQLLKILYERCQGGVVCLDGMIRMPFVQNGPQGFRVFGVTGAYNNDPQIWNTRNDTKNKLRISGLNEAKRRTRVAA